MAESFASRLQFDHDCGAVGPAAHDVGPPHAALDLSLHESESILERVQLAHKLILDVPLEADRCFDGRRGPFRLVLRLVGGPQIRAVRLSSYNSNVPSARL